MIVRSLFRASSFAVLGLSFFVVGCGDSAPAPAPAPAGGGGGAAPAPAPAGGGGASFDAAKATATVSVKVMLKGDAPKMRPLDVSSDKNCGAGGSTEEHVVAKDGLLQNVIVYVSKGAEKWSFPAPSTAALLDQKGCVYHPHVLSVSTGQTINVKNSDPTMHNVHATPDKKSGNAEFNKSQINDKAPMLSVKFEKPETAIKVKCDVHNWMGSWIGVFSHPFHGVSGADGMVTLPKLPAGEYEITVWHEKLTAPAAQKVTVGDGESKTVEFSFESK